MCGFILTLKNSGCDIKISLPPEFKVQDSKADIASKDREQAAVLSKCGKFTATTLKLLSEIQCNHDNPTYVAECLDNLHITRVALIRYIQEEISSLVVAGQFGGTTHTVFRATHRTSVYTPELILIEDCYNTDTRVPYNHITPVSKHQDTKVDSQDLDVISNKMVEAEVDLSLYLIHTWVIVVLLQCGSSPFKFKSFSIKFRIWNNSSSSDVLYIQASISPKYESK